MRPVSILGILILTLILNSPGAVIVAAQNGTPAAIPETGFVSLFDGTESSFAAWEVVGQDGFVLEDGVIVANPLGEDLGLLYYAPRTFADFVLRLQFRITALDDNSGVYVRVRDPRQPIPATELYAPDAAARYPHRGDYANGSWMAVDTGFEVQIDELAAGDPPGLDQHRTGAIYDIPLGTGAGEQNYQRGPHLQPGEWNDLEITVSGETYTVALNGQVITSFTNPDSGRGLSPLVDAASGYIGVQSHPFISGHVYFRNIRIKEMPAPAEEGAATPATTAADTVALLWESTGDPARSLREPSALAIDPQGTLWVADSHHDQFQLFAPDGRWLESWGTSGSAAGQFDFVRSDDLAFGAVAFAPDGTYYVADTGNDRVQVVAPDRHWLATWGSSGREDGQFVDPIAIAVGQDGLVYVVDDYRDDVQVFARDGGFVRRFGAEGIEPGQFLDAGAGIAFDRAGDVLVADFGGDQIERFAPDGTYLDTWGGAGSGPGQHSGPQAIAVDDHGRVYVADSSNYRIQVLTAEGTYLTAWGSAGSEPGQFHFPAGLVLDGQGHVSVSDASDNRVQTFRLPALLAP